MLIFLFLVSAQIILESFPISSSGHLLLIENFIHLFYPDAYISVFNNIIVSHFLHGPTALVLAIFFYDRWSFLLFHIKRCWAIILKLIFFAFVADLITFPFFIFLRKIIDCSFFPIGIGFLISAAALFSLNFCQRKTYSRLTISKVAIIGVAQGISLLPGISRFGLTFVTACCLGIRPSKAFAFSFAIQWPLIMFGFLESLLFLHKMPTSFKNSLFSTGLLITIIISSVIAFFALGLVKRLIDLKKLWVFSIILCFSFFSWLIFVCFM